jgi:hypothetical protein
MSSSYVRRAPLYDDSDYSSSTNTDNDGNTEPDVDSSSMPLPPEDFYTTEKELFDAIQAWAKQHKYAFRKLRSKPIGNSRKKVTYSCTRCGNKPIVDRPENDLRRPRERIRSTRTMKTGCEFSVCGVQVDDHHWDVRHRLGLKFGIHNHPQSHSALEHVAHRRLDQAQAEKARELYSLGKFKYLRALRKLSASFWVQKPSFGFKFNFSG